MTTKRLLVLLGVLVVGMTATFLLPAAAVKQPAGIALALPDYVGSWYGTDVPVTPREREVLAADTEFARKRYTNGLGDSIYVSIVLSGHDLDNSIHRPERCLPAQGWTIDSSNRLRIPVGERALDVTRLHDVRPHPTTDGKTVSVYNLNYYWFVGYRRLTASHLERTFIDIRDRVARGYNQRWAYVMVGADVTEGLIRFGKNEKQTDAIIQDFIRQLYPTISAQPESADPVPKS